MKRRSYKRPGSIAGFTLVEVLIASALSATVILGAMSLLKTFQKGTARSTNRLSADGEITEIKNLIQSAFRSRYTLGVGGATTIVPAPNGFPWELSQDFSALFNFAPTAPNNPAFALSTGSNYSISSPTLAKCSDLLVRRHRPVGISGDANIYTAVELLFFTSTCTTNALPPNSQLFSASLTSSDIKCLNNTVQFAVRSVLYFANATYNDAPTKAPIPDTFVRETFYPTDQTKNRSIAVCFREDPPGSSPKSLPPYSAAGVPNPLYPRNLIVEIRAQSSTGDDFNSGRILLSEEKFVIPIPNSTVEFLPSVSSP